MTQWCKGDFNGTWIKYWIIKERQFVRRVIHKCIICRKLEVLHMHYIRPLPCLFLE